MGMSIARYALIEGWRVEPKQVDGMKKKWPAETKRFRTDHL